MSLISLQTIGDIFFACYDPLSYACVTDRLHMKGASMPLGTLHTIEGTIRRGQRNYVLTVHGGGEWQLEDDRRLPKHVDASVVVEGVRTGFNRMEVVRIKRDGEDWPAKPNWTMWFNRFRKGKG